MVPPRQKELKQLDGGNKDGQSASNNTKLIDDLRIAHVACSVWIWRALPIGVHWSLLLCQFNFEHCED